MSDPRFSIETARNRHGIYSFEGQRLQYPQRGQPGEIVYITYAEDNPNASVFMGTQIDCLLYYDERGLLAGILNHYPYGAVDKNTLQEIDKPNSVSLFVRPDDNQAKVTKLLEAESIRRWGRAAVEKSPWPEKGHLPPGYTIDGNRRQGLR